jgi:hypothetical protein
LDYTTVTKRQHKQLQAVRVYHEKRGELIAVRKKRSKLKNGKLRDG